MADSNPQRRDPVDILADDPFAELTRIMGHDPRAESAHGAGHREQFEPAEPEIDLEQELLGELDFAGFEDQAHSGDWRDDMHAGAQDDVASVVAPSQDAFGDEELSVGLVEKTPHEPAPEAYAPQVAYVDEPEFELDLELDAQAADWEAQPFVEVEPVVAPVAPALASGDDAYAYAPSAVDDDMMFVADEHDSFDFDDDLGNALERELYSVAEPARAGEPVAAASIQPAVSGFDAAPVEAAVQDDSAASDAGAFDEQDLGFLIEDEEPFRIDEPEASVSGIDWNDEAPVDSAPVEAATPAAAAPSSLEDELNTLLASHGFSAASPAAPVEAAHQPVASPYSRVNFAARPAAAATGAHPVAGFDAPVATLDDEDLSDIFGEELKSEAPPAPQPVEEWQATVAPSAPVADHWAPEPEEPVEVVEEAPELPEDDVLAHWQPEPLTPAAAATHWTSPEPAEAPEIETQDVVEGAQVMVDDLDIPEVAYADEPAAPGLYDDFEGEFAQAMGNLPLNDRSANSETAAATNWAASPAAFAVAPAAAMPSASFDDPLQPADGQTVAAWQAGQQSHGDPLDFDAEMEHAITMASYEGEEERPQPSRRRGALIAAVVAGVAVIGGAGVFAMSLLGGGSDSPALVRADADPMKVRPENPGGTTVPNQNNEVYQRVSGGAADAAPEQERLITTTEEPVNLAAQPEEPALLPPGITDGEDEIAALAAGEAIDEVETALAPVVPKAEDRVPATEEASATAAAEEALVTPRRVRTMIVRPDGTMVAREDPAPAAQPVEEETVIAAAPMAAAPALAPAGQVAPSGQVAPAGQAVASQPVVEEDGGPVVDTPPTVSVVPSQRSEPAATAQPAPVQQPAAVVAQPAVQQPAAQAPVVATPVSAPAAAAPSAAAASEWSMQIASQPTAESAQATYQDLARRYGGVLEGRGVNIVRADIAGKGIYYRVRIPASSRDEAIRLCTSYKSAGGSCFVSR